MSSDDPLIGYQLGNFRLERVIGRGGMAQVYYGHDVKLNRPVAIKVIDVRYRGNPDYVKRFVREARAVALWRHENIMQIYYADDQDGLYYFVMEYVEGMDLGGLIASYNMAGELIPHSDIGRIGRAVAGALDYAHERGVIHRDIKPSNIMVSRSGRVVLADFGLAMEVGEGSVGEVFGTARYIAPEQARRSADAIPQSDLYSLSVVLFEMLTGVPPFDDSSPTSTAVQHITQPPPAPSAINPNLTPEIDAVLLKALSKAPKDRYQSGGALMEALEAALMTCVPVKARSGAEGIELPPPPPQWRGSNTPSLSQMSVVERVALKVAASPIVSGKSSVKESLNKRRRRQLFFWSVIGGAILGFLGLTYFTSWDNQQRTATATAQAIALLSQTPPTITPSLTPEPTATIQPSPTLPPSPTPTETPIPSPTPTPTASPTPTIKYPDGVRLLMFYSETGFYLRNMGPGRISVTPLVFEELDLTSELPTGHSYNASRWADIFRFLDPTKCNALEDARNPAPPDKRPVQCQDKLNVIRTLDIENSQYVFWRPRPRVSWFRVLWRDEEVGRCEIEVGVCQVYVPKTVTP